MTARSKFVCRCPLLMALGLWLVAGWLAAQDSSTGSPSRDVQNSVPPQQRPISIETDTAIDDETGTDAGRPDADATLATPMTQRLSGSVRLVDEAGQSITAAIDLSEAVVYFNPEVPVRLEPPEAEALLTTSRRRFVPRVLVVEAGSIVRFPNEDPILHNVFSSSPGNRFDLGLYGRDPGDTHQFNEPGLVRVFCNVHSGMSAHIVVVDTPFHLRPDRRGLFRFDALPQGNGTLTAWHERSDPVQVAVTIGAEAVTLEPIELRATVRQIAPQRERLRRRRRRY